ncbi:hypothetical protein P5V15_001227 [Pogonomyrmex californicus]
MLGDKRFDVSADDSVIVGDARYLGTPGLYELIFKRLPDVVYTENDKQTYKNTVDYKRPSTWPQRAYVCSRERRLQVQAHHHAALAR